MDNYCEKHNEVDDCSMCIFEERQEADREKIRKGRERYDSMQCISYDGKFGIIKNNIYQCSGCLRTVCHPVMSYYAPNLECHCCYPHHINVMNLVATKCPPGYTERKGDCNDK